MKLIIKGDFTIEGDVPEKLMQKGDRFEWVVLETISPPSFRITQFSKKEFKKELSGVKK